MFGLTSSIRTKLYARPTTLLAVGLAVGWSLHSRALRVAVQSTNRWPFESSQELQPAVYSDTAVIVCRPWRPRPIGEITRQIANFQELEAEYRSSREYLNCFQRSEARRLLERDLTNRNRLFQIKLAWNTFLSLPSRANARKVRRISSHRFSEQDHAAVSDTQKVGDRLLASSQGQHWRNAIERGVWGNFNIVVGLLAVTFLVITKWAVAGASFGQPTHSTPACVNSPAVGTSRASPRRTNSVNWRKHNGMIGKIRSSAKCESRTCNCSRWHPNSATAQNSGADRQQPEQLRRPESPPQFENRDEQGSFGDDERGQQSAGHASDLATSGRDPTRRRWPAR